LFGRVHVQKCLDTIAPRCWGRGPKGMDIQEWNGYDGGSRNKGERPRLGLEECEIMLLLGSKEDDGWGLLAS
jgi:hypothetical protein